jgi:hypothetical protein
MTHSDFVLEALEGTLAYRTQLLQSLGVSSADQTRLLAGGCLTAHFFAYALFEPRANITLIMIREEQEQGAPPSTKKQFVGMFHPFGEPHVGQPVPLLAALFQTVLRAGEISDLICICGHVHQQQWSKCQSKAKDGSHCEGTYDITLQVRESEKDAAQSSSTGGHWECFVPSNSEAWAQVRSREPNYSQLPKCMVSDVNVLVTGDLDLSHYQKYIKVAIRYLHHPTPHARFVLIPCIDVLVYILSAIFFLVYILSALTFAHHGLAVTSVNSACIIQRPAGDLA